MNRRPTLIEQNELAETKRLAVQGMLSLLLGVMIGAIVMAIFK